MPGDNSDAGWLWDMLDSARAVEQFVAGKTFDDYLELQVFTLGDLGLPLDTPDRRSGRDAAPKTWC